MLLCTGTTAEAFQTLVPPGIPGTGGGSGRRPRGLNNLSQQARQARITQLQQQHQAARSTFDQAQMRATSLDGEVAAAAGKLDSMREQVRTSRADMAAAAQRISAEQDRVIDAQPADSEYGRLAAALEQARVDLDLRMREILQLPPIPDDGLNPEVHRNRDLLALSREQRDQLDRHDDYVAARQKVSDLSRELKDLLAALLQADAGYQAAERERTAAAEAHRAANDEFRRASGDGVRLRKELQMVQQVVAQSRAAMDAAELELRQLGSQPGGGRN